MEEDTSGVSKPHPHFRLTFFDDQVMPGLWKFKDGGFYICSVSYRIPHTGYLSSRKFAVPELEMWHPET